MIKKGYTRGSKNGVAKKQKSKHGGDYSLIITEFAGGHKWQTKSIIGEESWMVMKLN